MCRDTWARVASQASLLLAIDHEARALRHVVGTNIATIVSVDGLGGWPQLLPALVTCLKSDSVPALEGALDALFKVPSPRKPGCDNNLRASSHLSWKSRFACLRRVLCHSCHCWGLCQIAGHNAVLSVPWATCLGV